MHSYNSVKVTENSACSSVNMIDEKVSVVITCYNYAHFLPYSMDAALSQTYEDLEVIVIDDGSTDNTEDVMKPYLADKRVKYIKQKNAGQAVAKNVGIDNSTGKYVAFLDADDIWENDKIKSQMKLFEDPEVGVVYCISCYIDENNNPIDHTRTSKYLRYQKGWVSHGLFLDNFVPFSSAIVRKECFDRLGGFDESYRMGIDWDLWLRLSVHYKFDYVDSPYLKYRKGHSGQMSKKYEVRKEDSTRIMFTFMQNNPDLLPKSLVTEARTYTYCNRGYHYRDIAPMESLKNYLAAIKYSILHLPAYTGLVKLLIARILILLGIQKN